MIELRDRQCQFANLFFLQIKVSVPEKKTVCIYEQGIDAYISTLLMLFTIQIGM